VKDLAFKTSHKENKTSSDKVYEYVDNTLDSSNTDDDELFFLTKNFEKMLKKHERRYKHRDHKENVVFYKCKRFGQYKSKCPNIEKGKEKEEDRENEKEFQKKKKKNLMSTWEDSNFFSSNSYQQAQIDLMESIVCNFASKESNEEIF